MPKTKNLWPEEIKVDKLVCDCGSDNFQVEQNDLKYGTNDGLPGILIKLSGPSSDVIRCMSCGKVVSEKYF